MYNWMKRKMSSDQPDKNKSTIPKILKSGSDTSRESLRPGFQRSTTSSKLKIRERSLSPSSHPISKTQGSKSSLHQKPVAGTNALPSIPPKNEPVQTSKFTVRPRYPSIRTDGLILPNIRTPGLKDASPGTLQVPAASHNSAVTLKQREVKFSPSTHEGLTQAQEVVPPKTTAKSRFRKVAAVLAFTRRREDMKQISPGLKLLVEEKKAGGKTSPKLDIETGLPFKLGRRHQTKSLFSLHTNVSDDGESIKTAVLNSNANSAYVVSDPLEKHYLVESTTNKLYAYFLTILAFVALFSAICSYALQHIPKIFAKDIFYYFFWYDLGNIILLIIILLTWSILGNMFLICPTRRNWNRYIRKVRWFLLATPFLLMHIYHINWNINLTRLDDEFYPDLSQRMRRNLKTGDNATLLLSQSYFQCCGVDSYTDWNNESMLYHGGYPPSCCSKLSLSDDSCAIPIRSHTRDKTLQVWPNGCLQMETRMINGVIMFVFTLLTAILISMYVALFYLMIAINIILKHEIIVQLPF